MQLITYHSGDILQSSADCLVCPVNCQGIMGKGLAKQFSLHWPGELLRKYKRVCQDREFYIGKPYIITVWHPIQTILLFPTKDHWRDPSRLEWIEQGLISLRDAADAHFLHVKDIAFPALGCGEGGLSWEEVKPLMERYLSELPIDVQIYEPMEERKTRHE